MRGAKVDEHVPLTFTADVYRKLFPHEYVKKCIDNSVRPDARSFTAVRSVHVQPTVVQTAASSCLVKFGNTSVVAAIKLAVGTPAVATPDQGEISAQVHLTPLCSNRFAVGRQSEESQSIASQLTRILIGSRVVEMSDLSIEKGKSAWKLMVDIYCLDHDGNVLDASLVAVMAALHKLCLPATAISEQDHIVSIAPDQDAAPLQLQHTVFSTTFATLCGQLIVDPTAEEEEQAESVFSLTYTTNGELCSVHKPGGAILAPDQLQACMVRAKKRAVELSRIVTTALA